MELSRDYEELFKILNACRIKYLVVGAHAVMYYTEPRFTKDIDLWIPPTLNKSSQVYKALKQFGAPMTSVTPETFEDEKLIFQIGVAPIRIDIMMSVPGLSPQKAWSHKRKARYGKTAINILGISDIIQAKETANRPQDRWDLDRLKKNK